MPEKIFPSYSFHIPFTISDKEWEDLELASELAFSKDHRKSVEEAVDEYLAHKCAMSNASSSKEVRIVLDRIDKLATDLLDELMLLKVGFFYVEGVRDPGFLEIQNRLIANTKKKFRKSENIPTEIHREVVSDYLRWIALKYDEDEHIVYSTCVALRSLITVSNCARRDLSKGGGNPGDPYINDMLSKVSSTYSKAGGGLGFSNKAKAFWETLNCLVNQYFEENSKLILKEAKPVLTEEAIKTRLTKIIRQKGAD